MAYKNNIDDKEKMNHTDIEKIIKKIEKYDNIRKEYEEKVYSYYNERREREKEQFGWNQAANTIPIISHLYNHLTMLIIKILTKKELKHLMF